MRSFFLFFAIAALAIIVSVEANPKRRGGDHGGRGGPGGRRGHHQPHGPTCEDGEKPECTCTPTEGPVADQELDCRDPRCASKKNHELTCEDGGDVSYGEFDKRFECSEEGGELSCSCEDADDCDLCVPWTWELSCTEGDVQLMSKKGRRDEEEN